MVEETLEQRGHTYRRRSGFHILPIIVIVAIVTILVTGINVFKKKSPNDSVSPVPKDNSTNVLSFLSGKKSTEELKKSINAAISGSLKNYSIYVKDLKGDFSFDIGKSIVYTATSVNKLPIFAALYAMADKGELNLDTVITMQADDIQDYGTGSMRYDEPGTTYSLKTLGKLMIQKSDNTAAYILARQTIGIEKIQKFVTDWGMVQTNIDGNLTSNADMELLLEKIYKGKLVNASLTKEMLSIMKDNEINDRLPAKLPEDALVYHKTGNGVGFIHDVGIIETPKSLYYVGIFTSDVSDEEKTINTIANLSKVIYDFMK